MSIGVPNAATAQANFKYIGLPPQYHGKIRRIASCGFADGTVAQAQGYYALGMDGAMFYWGQAAGYASGDTINQNTYSPQQIRF